MKSLSVTDLLALIVAALVGCQAAPGTVCRNDSDCGEGRVCGRPRIDGAVAEEGVCTYARLPEGELCMTTAECASGLFCSNDRPAEKKQRFGACIPTLGAGETCYRDQNCSDGLVCKAAGDTKICGAPAP